MKKIIVISGRVHSGKDSTAEIIKEYANNKRLNTIKLQFSSYIKEYAKKISDWDGSEENKPRELLQDLGETIRNNISETFFIDRIINDIKVYSNYFDIIMLTDARLPKELDLIKEEFPETIKIRLQRPSYDIYPSEKAKNHHTEHALDDYQAYDYIITNEGSLEDLKTNVEQILKNIL